MNRIHFTQHASTVAAIAARVAVFAACACTSVMAFAQKEPAASGSDGADASMVKPPQSAASGASAHNPDNMPIKRPDQTTNDRMLHAPPPASAAIAK
ncbi:hypothetical protein [Paraburkholderia phosphatilytica]|uniref:hypothetical protein n=1 Tax=Paraburkholderia phosphatilytica TaxID=2282883 RepID=UPI000E55482F|nr:hypothetical protein [Paraburkholderia phosphatilytica]